MARAKAYVKKGDHLLRLQTVDHNFTAGKIYRVEEVEDDGFSVRGNMGNYLDLNFNFPQYWKVIPPGDYHNEQFLSVLKDEVHL